MAAHSVGVAYGVPARPGFARAIARRSPPRPTGTRSPARAASGYRSLHRQTWGTAFGDGTIGIKSAISVHSGIRFSRSKSRYNSCSWAASSGVGSGAACPAATDS
ncbi:hypothetical protein SAMN04487914_101146 [Arthrobacter sp. ok909]|nr:hypothetical protein SAMN04487914_101146 [Arthrobacter sp. ok909]